MKKLLIFFASVLCVALPGWAEIVFRMEGPDSIVLHTDDPYDNARFIQALEEEDKSLTNTTFSKQPLLPEEIPSDTGVLTIPNWPFISHSAFSRVNKNSIFDADLRDDFDAIKGEMIRDIKAVNWKTGYNISARDLSFWDRLKYVCGRVTSAGTANMQITAPGFSSEEIASGIEKLTQSALNSMQCYMFDQKLKQEVRYTPEGLYWEIITNKPFLLLTIDGEVYKVLEAVEKSIIEQYGRTNQDRLLGQLVKNMAKFFDLRAKFYSMHSSFNNNTDEMMKMTKYSKGDAWSTWKVLADHTLRMNLVLEEEHLLSVEYEKGTLLALKKALMHIGQDAQKHRLQETVIRKDPQNAELVRRVDENYAHLRDLRQEAATELQTTPDTDKELLLRAYKKN